VELTQGIENSLRSGITAVMHIDEQFSSEYLQRTNAMLSMYCMRCLKCCANTAMRYRYILFPTMSAEKKDAETQ